MLICRCVDMLICRYVDMLNTYMRVGCGVVCRNVVRVRVVRVRVRVIVVGVGRSIGVVDIVCQPRVLFPFFLFLFCPCNGFFSFLVFHPLLFRFPLASLFGSLCFVILRFFFFSLLLCLWNCGQRITHLRARRWG